MLFGGATQATPDSQFPFGIARSRAPPREKACFMYHRAVFSSRLRVLEGVGFQEP